MHLSLLAIFSVSVVGVMAMGWNTINDDRNRFDEIRLFDQVDILVISLVVGLVIGWLLGHFVG